MAPLAAAGCLAFATGLGGGVLARRRRAGGGGGGRGGWGGARGGEEADAVTDGGHGRAGRPSGPGRPPGRAPVELRLVGEHLLGPLPDRGERADHHLGHVLLVQP